MFMYIIIIKMRSIGRTKEPSKRVHLVDAPPVKTSISVLVYTPFIGGAQGLLLDNLFLLLFQSI
jgi:hypothetical protein